jgi:hypothetical protein
VACSHPEALGSLEASEDNANEPINDEVLGLKHLNDSDDEGDDEDPLDESVSDREDVDNGDNLPVLQPLDNSTE